jgi:hypothetical protein
LASLASEELRAAVRDGCRNGYDGHAFDTLSWGRPWDVAIEGVTCPTYLVYGGADTRCPPVIGPWYRERIPHAELTTVPGADHLTTAFVGRDLMLPRLMSAFDHPAPDRLAVRRRQRSGRGSGAAGVTRVRV